jgi:hypothetical protein
MTTTESWQVGRFLFTQISQPFESTRRNAGYTRSDEGDSPFEFRTSSGGSLRLADCQDAGARLFTAVTQLANHDRQIGTVQRLANVVDRVDQVAIAPARILPQRACGGGP